MRVVLILSTLSTLTRCLLLDDSKQRVLFSAQCKQEFKQSLSDKLVDLIEELFKKATNESPAPISLKDISAIYVLTGPGAFTGLRVGVNFVKGLAAPHNIPTYGVPTKLLSDKDIFIPMRQLMANDMTTKEALASKMEFLHIKQNGESTLEKPSSSELVLGCKETWDWPSEKQLLTAVQKVNIEEGTHLNIPLNIPLNTQLNIDYGIKPKISGKRES